MFVQKRWGFGLGTIFSLIVTYFIFLYSQDKGWTVLAFVSKWYLILVGGLMTIVFGILLIVILFSLLMLGIAMLRLSALNKKNNKNKSSRLTNASTIHSLFRLYNLAVDNVCKISGYILYSRA